MEPALPRRFLVDRNAGRLCTWLRAMGFDATFAGPEDDGAIVRTAIAEGRTVVTKDRKMAERKVVANGTLPLVLITGDRVDRQVAEIVEAVSVSDSGMFSRCLRCNVELVPVAKESVEDLVPPYVYAHHEEFSHCPSCCRVYWHGTHWDHMRSMVAEAKHG